MLIIVAFLLLLLLPTPWNIVGFLVVLTFVVIFVPLLVQS